jgi:FAD/FMN-containing dehydrogenase
MDRRRFLEIAGAATAATLVGCGSDSSSSSTLPSTVTSSGLDWSGLAAKMQGSLILPGNALYDETRVVYNSRFDSVMPQAIALCASAADVSAVLAMVRASGLAVTPRSGGHGYGGYSTGSGVVIDVGSMNTITIGSGTATIGAGAKLVDVYDQLSAQGVGIPTGSCESVGIAGITQGGGIGVVDRAFGLTCDALVSAQVVTADGNLLTCDADTEPDLFWGIRGGGGGNFGIVTSFTFNTHPTSDITTAYAYFSMDDALNIMAAWQAWPQTIPDTIWGEAAFGWTAGSDPYIALVAICVGSTADLTPYWNALLTATQSTPSNVSITTASYRDTMLGGCGSLTVSECHLTGETADAEIPRLAIASTSDLFDAVVPDAGIQALRQAFLTNFSSYSTAVADGSGAYWIFDLMGGAIDQVATDATAFVHRGTLFSAEYYNYHPVGTVTNAELDSEQAAAHNVRSIMSQWSSGRAYVNYIDPLITNWQTAYYGSNYARLVQVKAKYDPANIFHLPQGIPTS